MISQSSIADSLPKLPWLRRLRWTAVAGQTATLAYVTWVLRVPLPLPSAGAVIAFTALTNAVLHRVPRGRGESAGFLAAILALDVGLMTVLLGLTGGPHNPFATLYLVLVALAAVALTPALTGLIAGLSCAGYAWLFLAPDRIAHPGDPVCGVGPNLPLSLHLRGMVIAYGLTAILVAFFAARLQQALRRHQEALARAREVSADHERFAALATLAAGAAHELGTPLGTIVVAATELAREARTLPHRPDLTHDADLIRAEAHRCRSILDRLQNHAEDAPRELDVERLIQPLRARFPGVRFHLPPQPRPLQLFAPPQALAQALANLIGNALEASPPPRPPVDLHVRPSGPRIEFEVTDAGTGLTGHTLAHAGEPFFTTKPPGRGMGLGLFLVRVLARRLAGEFRIESPPGGGTRAILSLPLGPGGAHA